MPRYEVTQTATAEVWAKNEMEAIEYATGEFFAFPEYNHEVKNIAPNPRLSEIVNAIRDLGVSAYVDDYKNNSHDFIRLSATHGHPDDDENQFTVMVSLNDVEEFDGKAYCLNDVDGNEVLILEGSLHPAVIAYLVTKKVKNN